ncbi:MAG: NADH-quinone oxidoreductase subunit J [Chloroflexia bacterium]
MTALSVLFVLFAAMGLFGAVMVLVARNPVHSVLFMLSAFVSVAGMFVLMQAEFVAVLQVLVYSGAILVLFLFVIMLLARSERPIPALSQPLQAPVAITVGLMLAVEIGLVVLTGAVDRGVSGPDTPQAIAAVGGNVEALGRQLYTTWLLPFEVASVLLLVAAIGAIYLAKEEL